MQTHKMMEMHNMHKACIKPGTKLVPGGQKMTR